MTTDPDLAARIAAVREQAANVCVGLGLRSDKPHDPMDCAEAILALNERDPDGTEALAHVRREARRDAARFDLPQRAYTISATIRALIDKPDG